MAGAAPWTPFGSNPGSMSMERSLFTEAQAVLQRPPKAIENKGLPHEVYLAAVVVNYLTQKIEYEQRLGPEPRAFMCPYDVVPIVENVARNCYECPGCGQAFTHLALNAMFFPTASPRYNVKTDPATYLPRLTTPLPNDLDPEDLADRGVSEVAHEQDEPVVLWRAWRYYIKPINSTLEPPPSWETHIRSVNNALWPHRDPLVAEHQNNPHIHGVNGDKLGVPNWRCQCGIYAVKTLKQAQEWGKAGGNTTYIQVLGKVVMWGKVLNFETGAKSQYAYPKMLWLPETELRDKLAEAGSDKTPEGIASTLAANYGIDVEVDDGMFNLGLSHA